MKVNGLGVKNLLVAELLDISSEYYAAVTIDRQAKSVVAIFSASGGMDIEEIAASKPDKIQRLAMIASPQQDRSQALRKWLANSFADHSLASQAAAIMQNMYRLFRDKDCSLVEINPLALTAAHRLVAADAKIVFDDNAVARHADIARLANPEEYTPDELKAKAAGLSYVSLCGDIGCMVNGAGLAMATLDGITLAGGNAANFLDIGGSSNPQKVLHAMNILAHNSRVKAILINIFGGITRCDEVAAGILLARQKLAITVPIVIRLIGTNEQKARNMLKNAGMIALGDMNDAIDRVVEYTHGGTRP